MILFKKISILFFAFVSLGECYQFTTDKFNPRTFLPFPDEFKNGDFLFLHRYDSWKYWSDFHLGFPDISIGVIFPTFQLLITDCGKKDKPAFGIPSSYNVKACYAQFISRYCARFHYSDFPDADTPESLREVKPDDFCMTKFKKVMKKEYSVFFTRPYYDVGKFLLVHHYTPDGRLDEANFNYIGRSFKDCESISKSWCQRNRIPKRKCPTPYRFCGFSAFVQMYLRAQVSRHKNR